MRFSQIHAEVSHIKHQDVKIISAKTGKSKKELLNEAVDFLIEKYKECLGN